MKSIYSFLEIFSCSFTATIGSDCSMDMAKHVLESLWVPLIEAARQHLPAAGGGRPTLSGAWPVELPWVQLLCTALTVAGWLSNG